VDARRAIGGRLAADVQADARVALAAVPVTPVAVEIEQEARDLVR
jgi:hypothetical protein